MLGIDQILATAMTLVSGVISIVQLRRGWRHAWFVATLCFAALSVALWLFYNNQIGITNLSTNEQSIRAGNAFRVFWEVKGRPCNITLSADSQDKRVSQTWDVQAKGDRDIVVPKDINDTSVSVTLTADGCLGGTLSRGVIVPFRETRFTLTMTPDKIAYVGDLITIDWSTNGSDVSFEVFGLPSLNRLQSYHEPSGTLIYRAREAGDGAIRAVADGPGGKRPLRFTYEILEKDPSFELQRADVGSNLQGKPAIDHIDFQDVLDFGSPLSLHWVTRAAESVTLLQSGDNSSWRAVANYKDGETNMSLPLHSIGLYRFRLLAENKNGASTKDFNVTVRPQVSDFQTPVIRSFLQSPVVPARVLHKLQPYYPPIAKQMRVQGAVVLTVTIGPDGKVHDVQVDSGNPMLREAASTNVLNWMYLPATVNGVPVESKQQIIVNFDLSK